ncbi:rep protein [Circoviridae sp.]|nr:rep protein [Circoviridae sp.]UOF82717.1 rep protein [Circoviridae sp.]
MSGNTKSSSSRENAYYKWFFTFNNYSEDDIIMLRLLFDRITKLYKFQEETGANGTKHLQGCISLIKKERFSTIKKYNDKIHWEKTRNEERALAYSCKEETRTGRIFTNEKLKAFIRTKTKFDSIRPLATVMDIIKEEPDHRSIHWVYSSEGGVGKTSTAAFIERNYQGVCVANGKAGDIKNTVIKHLEENELDIMIVTIPRSAQEYLGGLYGVLEEIKDGLIYSGKYEGGFKNIEHPHVIVMCNFEPDYLKMSCDRWNVIEL